MVGMNYGLIFSKNSYFFKLEKWSNCSDNLYTVTRLPNTKRIELFVGIAILLIPLSFKCEMNDNYS